MCRVENTTALICARLWYMETSQEEEEYRVVTWVSKFDGIYMVEWNSVGENCVTECEYNVG